MVAGSKMGVESEVGFEFIEFSGVVGSQSELTHALETPPSWRMEMLRTFHPIRWVSFVPDFNEYCCQYFYI